MANPPEQPSLHTAILQDIRRLIQEARRRVASKVNAEVTLLYWHIDQRIHQEILQGDRADYGKEILATLSQQLTQDFGTGFSYSALTRMIKFNQCFPEQAVVSGLSQ